jgi:hypothetical protein
VAEKLLRKRNVAEKYEEKERGRKILNISTWKEQNGN